MNAIDLFAGCGGLSLGFEMADFNVVFAVEHDESIAKSYKLNHPTAKILVADIQKLPLETFAEYVGKIAVVIGGPPCQGFSQKGQRKTTNDERNFLFKYFLSVVAFLQPQYFVIENVPNLLTTANSYFKHEIETLCKNHNYFLEMGILNAADFGVPQNRRRAVILGKRNAAAPKLPQPQSKKVTIWDAIGDLAFLAAGEGVHEGEYRLPAKTAYQKKLRKGSKILYNHVATKHSALALERLNLIPPNSGKEALPAEHLTKSIYSGTWTRMCKDELSATITTRFDTPSSGKFTHPYLHRAITVREAARIQSFPDTFQFIGTKGSQMKQVGNAVPPLLARAVAQTIMHDIKGGSL